MLSSSIQSLAEVSKSISNAFFWISISKCSLRKSTFCKMQYSPLIYGLLLTVIKSGKTN